MKKNMPAVMEGLLHMRREGSGGKKTKEKAAPENTDM
jgi:hypothetical protein